MYQIPPPNQSAVGKQLKHEGLMIVNLHFLFLQNYCYTLMTLFQDRCVNLCVNHTDVFAGRQPLLF